MSTQDMHTYLASKRPTKVDSAYSMAKKHRITETSARNILIQNGYELIDHEWIRQQSQLDRIEFMLTLLMTSTNNSSHKEHKAGITVDL